MNTSRFTTSRFSRLTLENRIDKFLNAGQSARFDSQRPKIGLALSGGGAKGAIHVGVLQALADMGIHVDIVSGTSVGAFIGAYYCSGISPNQISQLLLKDFQISKFWKWIPGGKFFRLARMLRSGHALQCIARNISYRNVEELPKKFVATATDLCTGESVHLDQGCLTTAVAASLSVPGLTRPVERDGKLLTDGGLLENLPVTAAKNAGADIVIAVDIAEFSDNFCAKSASTMTGSMGRAWTVQLKQLNEQQTRQADVVIRPKSNGMGFADFDRCAIELADIGEQAAKKELKRHYHLLTNG